MLHYSVTLQLTHGIFWKCINEEYLVWLLKICQIAGTIGLDGPFGKLAVFFGDYC